MIPLTNNSSTTIQTLVITLGGVATTTYPTCTVVSYTVPRQTKDDNSEYQSSTEFTLLTAATETTISAAPPTGSVKDIIRAAIYNADTVSATVIIAIDDNGTNRNQIRAVLLTLETLHYEGGVGGRGWYVTNANGDIKTVNGSIFSSLTVTGLIDISASGAGQIKFPATQNASADANTLDDYEEGTWTPIDASGAALAFVTASGTYEKIGRQFRAGSIVAYPVTVDGTAASIGGLPFTINNSAHARQGFITVSDEITLFYIFPVLNTTTFTLNGQIGGAVTNATMSTNSIYSTVLSHV